MEMMIRAPSHPLKSACPLLLSCTCPDMSACPGLHFRICFDENKSISSPEAVQGRGGVHSRNRGDGELQVSPSEEACL